MDKFDRYPTDDEITFAKRNGKVAIFDKVQGTFDLDPASVGAWAMIEAPEEVATKKLEKGGK
jgi:hypothetical protein